MRKYLIEEWHKKWSVWIASLLAVISELWQYLPFMREYCPPEWVSIAFIVVLVARIIRQDKAPEYDHYRPY